MSIFFSGQKTTMILYRQSGILYIFWHWWRTLSFTTSVEPTTDISRNKLRSGLSTMGGNHLLLLGYKKKRMTSYGHWTYKHQNIWCLTYIPQNLDKYQILIKDLGRLRTCIEKNSTQLWWPSSFRPIQIVLYATYLYY